jgi:hypothetical protein
VANPGRRDEEGGWAWILPWIERLEDGLAIHFQEEFGVLFVFNTGMQSWLLDDRIYTCGMANRFLGSALLGAGIGSMTLPWNKKDISRGQVCQTHGWQPYNALIHKPSRHNKFCQTLRLPRLVGNL